MLSGIEIGLDRPHTPPPAPTGGPAKVAGATTSTTHGTAPRVPAQTGMSDVVAALVGSIAPQTDSAGERGAAVKATYLAFVGSLGAVATRAATAIQAVWRGALFRHSPVGAASAGKLAISLKRSGEPGPKCASKLEPDRPACRRSNKRLLLPRPPCAVSLKFPLASVGATSTTRTRNRLRMQAGFTQRPPLAGMASSTRAARRGITSRRSASAAAVGGEG